MSNKTQSKPCPASNPIKICLQKRRPSIRNALESQSADLQQINQNRAKVAHDRAVPSHNVFVVVSTQTSRREIVFSLGSVMAPLKEGTASTSPVNHLGFVSNKQTCEKGEVAQLQHSFIEDLLNIDDQLTAPPKLQTKKLRLQQLNIIEAQSFSDENSSLFDAHSEAVALTQEEQQFFTNFITAQIQQPHEQDCQGSAPKKQIQNSSIPSQPAYILTERKRVIRNFFRPKASFFKDDKTRCNSSTNLDQINDSSNRNSFSPMRNDGQRSGTMDKSSKFLSPFIE